jgi:hypothetical protein
MSKHPLREAARGQDCKVNIYGVCNNDRNTVILAHINERSLVGAGMGQKVPDEYGAHCCHACHDEIDGRTNNSDMTRDEKLIAQYQGVIRTQHWAKKEGLLWTS